MDNYLRREQAPGVVSASDRTRRMSSKVAKVGARVVGSVEKELQLGIGMFVEATEMDVRFACGMGVSPARAMSLKQRRELRLLYSRKSQVGMNGLQMWKAGVCPLLEESEEAKKNGRGMLSPILMKERRRSAFVGFMGEAA